MVRDGVVPVRPRSVRLAARSIWTWTSSLTPMPVFGSGAKSGMQVRNAGFSPRRRSMRFSSKYMSPA